jgi:hypothetical protein
MVAGAGAGLAEPCVTFTGDAAGFLADEVAESCVGAEDDRVVDAAGGGVVYLDGAGVGVGDVVRGAPACGDEVHVRDGGVADDEVSVDGDRQAREGDGGEDGTVGAVVEAKLGAGGEAAGGSVDLDELGGGVVVAELVDLVVLTTGVGVLVGDLVEDDGADLGSGGFDEEALQGDVLGAVAGGVDQPVSIDQEKLGGVVGVHLSGVGEVEGDFTPAACVEREGIGHLEFLLGVANDDADGCVGVGSGRIDVGADGGVGLEEGGRGIGVKAGGVAVVGEGLEAEEELVGAGAFEVEVDLHGVGGAGRASGAGGGRSRCRARY